MRFLLSSNLSLKPNSRILQESYNLTKRGWGELNYGYQASWDDQQATKQSLEQQPTKEGAKGYK